MADTEGSRTEDFNKPDRSFIALLALEGNRLVTGQVSSRRLLSP
jgi:hypothetical protein